MLVAAPRRKQRDTAAMSARRGEQLTAMGPCLLTASRKDGWMDVWADRSRAKGSREASCRWTEVIEES
jgi:hypothetical protein